TDPRRGCGERGAHRQEETRGIRVANIKSQIKRVKTNEKRRLRNKPVKSAARTAVRKFREAAEAGDTERAVEPLPGAARAPGSGASKAVTDRNQAANRKSAMAKRLAEL